MSDKPKAKKVKKIKQEKTNNAANYLNKVINNNKAFLTAEEEIELAKKKDKGDKKARDKLILSNMRLVISIANDYGKGGICDIEDLISEGNIGITKGIDKFDWKRVFRISTYTTWWIRQTISRYIAEHSKSIKVPVHLQDINKKVQKIIKEYQKDLGENPTASEIAGLTDISIEHIERAMTASKNFMISINDIDTNDNGNKSNETEKFLKDQTIILPSESLERTEIEGIITEIVNNLSPIESKIFKLRFGIDELKN